MTMVSQYVVSHQKMSEMFAKSITNIEGCIRTLQLIIVINIFPIYGGGFEQLALPD